MATEIPKLSEPKFLCEILSYLSEWLLGDDDESSPELPIEEEKLQELMQELYTELNHSSPPSTKVDQNFPSPSCTLPSPPLSGKIESCGAAVSSYGSTAVAGIDNVGGPAGNIGKERLLLEWWKNGDPVVGEKTDGGCHSHDAGWEVGNGGDEDDDQWLERVLDRVPSMEFEV